MYFGLGELDEGAPGSVDAVVHFAAIPRLLLKPDNEVYRVNVIGTYNVIEAALKLGIKKVIIASSETTYGVCFAEGHKDFHRFPLDEDYDVDPMDSYALSKVNNEQTARAFAARFDADVYALRIGNVIEPREYAELFPRYLEEPALRADPRTCDSSTRGWRCQTPEHDADHGGRTINDNARSRGRRRLRRSRRTRSTIHVSARPRSGARGA